MDTTKEVYDLVFNLLNDQVGDIIAKVHKVDTNTILVDVNFNRAITIHVAGTILRLDGDEYSKMIIKHLIEEELANANTSRE